MYLKLIISMCLNYLKEIIFFIKKIFIKLFIDCKTIVYCINHFVFTYEFSKIIKYVKIFHIVCSRLIE